MGVVLTACAGCDPLGLPDVLQEIGRNANGDGLKGATVASRLVRIRP